MIRAVVTAEGLGQLLKCREFWVVWDPTDKTRAGSLLLIREQTDDQGRRVPLPILELPIHVAEGAPA